MTVTIVSSSPPTSQATTVDTGPGKDSTTDSLAFASLLLGQLMPVVPQQALPETKTEAAAASADDASVDPASILAALIAPADLGRGVDSTSGNAAEQSSDLSVLGRAAQSRTGQLPEQPALDGTIRNLQSKENVALEPASSDDKPAKFAVPASLALIDKPLSLAANQSADDSTAHLSSLAASHAFSQSNQLPVIRDTSLAIRTSFHDQNWGSDFSQKIVWLAGNDKQSAQLTLNPPQMGPIEISVTVDKGNATASFASANADVREAIETALPRLREMFASAGIQLGQTNVGAESFQQQAASDGANQGSSRWMSDNAILGASSAGSIPVRAFATQQGNGMVDIFA